MIRLPSAATGEKKREREGGGWGEGVMGGGQKSKYVGHFLGIMSYIKTILPLSFSSPSAMLCNRRLNPRKRPSSNSNLLFAFRYKSGCQMFILVFL